MDPGQNLRSSRDPIARTRFPKSPGRPQKRGSCFEMHASYSAPLDAGKAADSVKDLMEVRRLQMLITQLILSKKNSSGRDKCHKTSGIESRLGSQCEIEQVCGPAAERSWIA